MNLTGKDVSSNTFSKYLRFAAICDLILKLNKLFANICDLRFAICCHFLMMPICGHILGCGTFFYIELKKKCATHFFYIKNALQHFFLYRIKKKSAQHTFF